MSVRKIHLAAPVILALTSASWIASAAAQSVQIVTPATVQSQQEIVIAPTAPPPMRVETVPPPPSEEARTMYWRPGRWMWDGTNWAWAAGQYVERPAPQANWEPGRWEQRPNGGYVWVDGRWQG